MGFDEFVDELEVEVNSVLPRGLRGCFSKKERILLRVAYKKGCEDTMDAVREKIHG